jgi:hypothetical protein
MKAFAMQIWEMPADEFAWKALAVVTILMALRFIATEINIGRMKRMTRMGLR